jgi:hypothetical protein
MPPKKEDFYEKTGYNVIKIKMINELDERPPHFHQ